MQKCCVIFFGLSSLFLKLEKPRPLEWAGGGGDFFLEKKLKNKITQHFCIMYAKKVI
jgi:hypothetical protein